MIKTPPSWFTRPWPEEKKMKYIVLIFAKLGGGSNKTPTMYILSKSKENSINYHLIDAISRSVKLCIVFYRLVNVNESAGKHA